MTLCYVSSWKFPAVLSSLLKVACKQAPGLEERESPLPLSPRLIEWGACSQAILEVCDSPAIGVARDDVIPDSSFSASTHFNEKYLPSFARLNRSKPVDRGWAPKTKKDPADYLQIDLLYDFVICAVATQGVNYVDEWTTKYKINLSMDSSHFYVYKENNALKVFNGNSGRNDIVKHDLRKYALARFIRFMPTEYYGWKALRVEVYGMLLSAGPSQAPGNFTVTVISSSSIRASWTSLPEYARHGDITEYKLFFREQGTVDNSNMEPIAGAATLTKDVINLEKYTKYEFQVLAVNSRGEGPKSSMKVEQTLEDAPSIPSNLSHSEIKPDKPFGPKVKLTWHKPAKENGIIRSYTVFYSHNEDPHRIHTKTLGENMLSYTVDVLGGATYQFHVRAVTIKPGPNATKSVQTNEYEPSVAPKDVFSSTLNQTTFNISWSPLTREESYSKVTSYEIKAFLKSSGDRQKRSPDISKTVDTLRASAILYDIPPCYSVSVRAYTVAGPGPFSQPLPLETLTAWAPNKLGATNAQSTEMTLEWQRPQTATGENWKVEYSGKKSYNNSFLHEGSKDVQGTTKCTLDNLVPGTKYEFQVYGISKCGNKGSPTYLEKETEIGEPLAPVVPSLTIRKVSESQVEVELWPAEQRNGPISAYQVIVLRVVDGVETLPAEYKSQLEDSNKDSLNFYVAADIENIPVYEKSWKFTVGDGNRYGKFINKKLERGDDYIIYQRAITEHEGDVYGEVSEVARISVEAGATGLNAAAVAVPVVFLLLLIPAVVVAVFFYRSILLYFILLLFTYLRLSTLLFLAICRPLATYEVSNGSDAVDTSSSGDEELVYSQPDDGKPKPIPVDEFPKYFRKKSKNGAIVLREEFKDFLGGMQASWNAGRKNRSKNRYGNITTYDHSRVVLDKVEGDPTSDYINASYIP
ncbi:Tyrosine-protein phosphatase Lar, partial [Stylophora pistillata]